MHVLGDLVIATEEQSLFNFQICEIQFNVKFYFLILLLKEIFFGNAAIKGYTGPCIPMVTNIVMITRFNTCPSFPITFHTKKVNYLFFSQVVTTVDTMTVPLTEVFFPSVVVCNINQVRKSFFEELGIYDNDTFIKQIYFDYIEGKKDSHPKPNPGVRQN